jgi:flagellar basal-body rod protein FlgG
MLRGFYTAAAGMISQQRKTDVLTNNLANSNTPGFKSEQTSMRSFPEMLISSYDKQAIPSKNGISRGNVIGSLNTGVYLQETMPNLRQGDLQQTNRLTDIALQEFNLPVNPETGRPGSLFYTVQNQDGNVRYTKNGNFAIDGQGSLTTNEGFFVLDKNGQKITIQTDNFKVLQNGDVIEEGRLVGTIGVAFADNPSDLIKDGPGVFKFGNDEVLPQAEDTGQFTLNQGFIERSNVDVQQTMTDLMIAYRSFEANQKMLQAYDRSLEKAVNEIGRIG